MVKRFNQYFDLRDTSTIRLIPDDLAGCENDGCLIYQSADPVKLDFAPIINDICICSCPKVNKVFAEQVTTASYKNDKTSFLFRKKTAIDTIVIKLCNDEIGLELELNDNTLGTYYQTFTSQPKQIGFVLDWQKVLTTFLIGLYYFKIEKTILGTTSTEITDTYKLLEYSDELANGTVRIESYQKGDILNTDIIYTDLISGGWYNSVRFDGRLLNKAPNLVTDNYYNQSNELVQIQDRVDYDWVLESELINVQLSDLLIENMLLANKIVVSDFNVYSEAQIKNLEIYFAGIQEKKSFTHNTDSIYKLKLKNRKDNIIKSNY